MRLLRHLLTPHWLALRAFPSRALREIEAAIKASEHLHDGELRFAVETSLPFSFLNLNTRKRAETLFAQLGVWDTEHNSGVLIYVQLVDRRIEIVADRGISARVEQAQWSAICRAMEAEFKQKEFLKGALHAIEAITALLARHFPPRGAIPTNFRTSPLFFKALLFAAVALAQVAVPPLKARVTDLTGTLNQQQRTALEQTLTEFESRKGSQIAVLLVPTTKPEAPVEYAVRVFDSWKLGRKGIDDGVLLLVAKDDRRVWIATGRGVEGVLPDAIVKRIVDEDITPRFKQGDFYGGIRAGADRMMRLIEGEQFPRPSAQRQVSHWPSSDVLFFGLIFVLFLGGILRAIFGRLAGAGVVGGIAGIAAWIILSSLAFGAIAALIAFVVTLIGGGGTGGSSGWSSGGGGFSSSGGGGGFSGGGGSTSGGGAGGSW